jgi:hypothetical protein
MKKEVDTTNWLLNLFTKFDVKVSIVAISKIPLDIMLPDIEEMHCYRNAAFTMRHARAQGHAVDYVEGYVKIDPGIFTEHAWNAIDGVHFDVMAEYPDYYPVLRIVDTDTAMEASAGIKHTFALLHVHPEYR